MAQLPPEVRLTRLANAYQLSRAVQVAARLGLGRLLSAGKQSVSELAKATETHQRVLKSLLRFLAQIGVVQEIDDDLYGPTDLSDRLHLVDNVAQGEESYAVWGALPEALREGRCLFDRVHGATFYDYLAGRPEQRANWNEWNTSAAQSLAPWLAEALNLSGSETVVDVGGGEGSLLAEVLKRHPGCGAVLFDLPEVVEAVPAILAGTEFEDRCQVVGGDAFKQVPVGGDVYVLSRVLLNWDDDHVVRLLESCRQAMGETSVLKVVEQLMPDVGDARRRTLASSDLQLFLLWGGGHRTQGEMKGLLQQAGLRLVRVTSSEDSGWQILEARWQGCHRREEGSSHATGSVWG